MSVFTKSSPTSGTTSNAVLDAIRAIARWPARVARNRQLLTRLSGMSDHELSDIGLSRSDLSDSASLPLDSEVGSFFATRANERRRWRR